MGRPTIAIVGRPNVGKSTLFNRLTRTSKAIVKDVHGVTRDRNFGEVEWDDRIFDIIDTGGFFPDHEDTMFDLIREQALLAVQEADVVVHILDGKEGLNPLDRELAALIRAAGKKTIWAVNKVDTHDKRDRVIDFYAIGVEDLIPVSAESGYGIDELMERVLELAPVKGSAAILEYPKIAVIGKPNVGKSTLVNTLLGSQRMIVSPVAGTTRDAVDSVCTYYKRKYVLIDTAGIRKRSKISEPLEKYSVARALKSIVRADVVLVVMDATEDISEQDQNIAGAAVEKGKGIIFVFNKWDLIETPESEYEKKRRALESKMWFAPYAPLITISAKSRKRVSKIFPVVDEVIREASKRIKTSQLNELREGLEAVMPSFRGRKVKLYYLTQTGIKPPSFTFFVNYPEGLKQQHTRMIERLLRERYSFSGTPLNIYIRKRR